MMSPEIRDWLLSKVREEVREVKERLVESKSFLKDYEERCEDPEWNSASLPGLPAGLGKKSCWWDKVKEWKKEVKDDEQALSLLLVLQGQLAPRKSESRGEGEGKGKGKSKSKRSAR